MENKHPDPKQYWFHRRSGFYTGVGWAIIQTLIWIVIAVKFTQTMASLGPVIAWSYGVSLTLILAYYSNTLVEEIYKRKSNW